MAAKQVDFFLGTLSPSGFSGYFSQLVQDTGADVTLIKGGPGCGKSELLFRVAEYLTQQDAGIVEAIHSAGNPACLDAVLCAKKRFRLVDATEPHALEPAYPVAFEKVVTLYNALDSGALTAQREEIITQFQRYKALRERIVRYITAAGSLLQDTARTAQCFTDAEKARGFALSLSKRYLPAAAGPGCEEIRLLSALTETGLTFFENTIPTLADTIVVLDDAYGCAAKTILWALRGEALAKGHHVFTCYCSMSPYEKIEHLLIPSLGLAFVTSNSFHPVHFPQQRIIHCERFCNKQGLAMRRKRIRFNHKAAVSLLAQASALQSEAKRCRDALEQSYTQAMNFSAIDKAFDIITRAGAL